MKKKYAVIKIMGHQHLVSEKDEILVDKIVGKTIEPEVLLYVEENKVLLGKPSLKEVKAKVKILGEEKGEKIRVLKYKAKSRFRKVTGFRPQYSRLLVEKISTSK